VEDFQEVEETVSRDDSWDELLSSLERREFPWDGEYVIAAFDLVVAADESGIHDSAVVCLLAGYIASIRQWAIFTERWNHVLVKFDVTDFHSKDFFAFDPDKGRRTGSYVSRSSGEKKSYGDWSDADANEFISGLVDTICAGRINPIGASVDVPAFRRLTYGERKFLTGAWFDGKKWKSSGAPSKPYFLVYDHCLVEAGQKTKHGKKTLFIFDQQKQFESRAIEQFAESAVMLGEKRHDSLVSRYAGVLFRSRVGAPGLQAADLYAHCWHRYLTDPRKIGRQRADILEALTAKRPGMGCYNAEHFERMLGKLPEAVRAAMRAVVDPNA
jgi:hypothetical protein